MADKQFGSNIDLETCIIKTFQGDENDSMLPNEQPSIKIKSSKFQLGFVSNTSWTMQLKYAKVYEQSFYGPDEKVALLLERNGGAGKIKINGMFGLYDWTNCKDLATTSFEYEFEDGQQVITLNSDISMSEFSNALFEGSKLNIRGNINKSVNSINNHQDGIDIFPKTSESNSVFISQNNAFVELSNDLSSLLEEGSFSDFKIKCGDTIIKVHKSILSARSQIFKSSFDDPNFNLGIVSLKLPITKKMLHFIYCGQVGDLDFDSAIHLLFAAEEYQLQGLATICVKYIKSELTPDNALQLLTSADLYDLCLKDYVIDYISANFQYIQNTDDWTILKDFTNETLANKVLERTVKYLFNKQSNSSH